MSKFIQALRVGLILVLVGTLADLAYHAYAEPEEVFTLEGPEAVTHIMIAIGVALLIGGAIFAALFSKDS